MANTSPFPGSLPNDRGRPAVQEVAMDRINARWGRGSLRTLTTGFDASWTMRRKKFSPAWTTR